MSTPSPEKDATRTFNRGDIFYIHKSVPSSGSEQRPCRPAIIVSNDTNNLHSEVVEVVYLTMQRKPPLPTHVIIDCDPCTNSTILCEQIHSVDINKIGDYMGHIPEHLEESLNEALRVSLALSSSTSTPTTPQTQAVIQECERLNKQVQSLTHDLEALKEELLIAREANSTIKVNCAEAKKMAELYENMYNTLLDKLIARGVK